MDRIDPGVLGQGLMQQGHEQPHLGGGQNQRQLLMCFQQPGQTDHE